MLRTRHIIYIIYIFIQQLDSRMKAETAGKRPHFIIKEPLVYILMKNHMQLTISMFDIALSR